MPRVILASALGLGRAIAPSERIGIGVIGLGNRNQLNLSHYLLQKDVRCAIACDCFADRRSVGKQMVDAHYGNRDCATTRFHEEVFARDDIDAVLIATGDRWHAVLSCLASAAGKDVYCEKPYCLTFAEGRALVSQMARRSKLHPISTILSSCRQS